MSQTPLNANAVIEAWEEQLAGCSALIEGYSGQIEIRLYATGRKVRKRPMVVLNGGPTEMVDTSVT